MKKNLQGKPGKTLGAALLGATMVLGLAACGSQDKAEGDGKTDQNGQGVIKIVTSTNVYADIAQSIGGDQVSTKALIESNAQDPHSYEASVQDKLSVSEAELVIENGGGYDSFLHSLSDDAGFDGDRIITAVEVADPEGGDSDEEDDEGEQRHAEDEDHGHSHGEFNEHIWYSLESMEKVAGAIKGKLSSLRPDKAGMFAENKKSFSEELENVRSGLDDLKERYNHRGVVVTEPTPLYLLEDMGFEDKTPSAFSEAIEAEQEVSARVLDETRTIVKEQDIAFLADIFQAETPQTRDIVETAEQNNVPVISFSETIPEGRDYVDWMRDVIDMITQVVQ